MSLASQEAVEGGDILSQALFRTGLSTPVKLETEGEPHFILPENDILQYNAQNMAEDLMSGISHDVKYSVQQNVMSSSPGQCGFEVGFSNENGLYNSQPGVGGGGGGGGGGGALIPIMNSNNTDLTTSKLSPGTRSMPILRKMENGIVSVPTWKGVGYAATSNSNTEIDVDLEDLLSINVDEPEMDSYTHPQSSYSVPVSSNSYSPQYTTYPPAGPPIQHPPAATQHQLPELMDLDNILGDNDAYFLDTLNIDNNFTDRTYSPQDQVMTTPAITTTPVGGNTPPPSGRPLSHSSTANISNGLLATLSGLVGSKRDLISVNKNQFVRNQKKLPSPFPRQVPTVGIKGPSGSPAAPESAQQNVLADSDEEDDEDYTTADTYANYTPAKVKIGLTHPDSVVESSSLSSVDPPEVYFDLKLPQTTIQCGKLSSLQLESVVYACQQHMNILTDGSRAGFLIGDGAGVGKGRTIAGIIYQNYLEGRKKAIWLSVSNDLRVDALRDLKDVGAKKIDVYSLNKFHYGKISGKRNGRVRKGVIFATYSSLIGESSSGGKYKTRFDQLLHWLGSRFEGLIVFDECHKAKNLVPTGSTKPSKTGLTVLQLQKKLPKARIVYCSATGASEPKNMAYMSRLGIWGKGTQFNVFQDFIKAVERRGVGAMEIVAIDMKLRGMYIARQLSFSGVTFSVNEVELSDTFIEAYDASVKLWVETRRLFQEAADMLDYDKRKLKTMWGQFWASHQRFFKYMCIAAKVPETIRVAKKALVEGKCIVIGLQSTGEARTLEQLERSDGELSGFISTTKGVLETLIRRHFPAPAPEPGLLGIDWSLFENDPTLPQNRRKKRRSNGPRKSRALPTSREGEMSNSDSEDSSGSPERSDSAVESSSDEGDRSSEGSGSSSSESEDDADSDLNPFGVGDFNSEPWLQKKKTKVKSRKRPRSPSCVSGSSIQKRRKNFSIKPPPHHHSSKKGKTKTGFNSKNLNFEQVQSPDTQSSKISPSLLQQLDSHRPSPSLDSGHTSSIANINKNLANAQTLSGGGGGGLDVGRGSPLPNATILASPGIKGGGQNVLEAMSTKFNGGVPVGDVPEMIKNTAVKKMKEELLKKLELLSHCLPSNTLDELIDGLGGTRCVAEMTGRRGRVVSLPGGGVQYQLRNEQEVNTELLNIREKQRFMDGEKNIAIISEAASSGISLQADRRVKNQRRRVHITLELPWSADRAIQQFGRTHRSNQVSAPEYIFLISALSGEQRFASIVAKRLESLGALTHGDRRATDSRDLSKFNVDTKYGRQSLENTIKSIVGVEEPLTKMEEYNEEFFGECRGCMIGVGLFREQQGGSVSIEKDATTMSRFLNRILGLPVKLQNKLFSYFSDTLAAVMQQAKKTGRWDAGILDFGSSGDHVEIVKTEEYAGDIAFNTATTQLYTVQVGRGMAFDEALNTFNRDTFPGEGFYVSKKVCNNKRTAALFKAADSAGKQFLVYRPNTGRQGHTEKLSKLLKKFDKIDLEEGKKWWSAQYDSSLNTCSHAFWQGNCRLSVGNQTCSHGLRCKTYYMLSGSVLGVWTYIEGVFNRHPGHNQRMQIIRVKTESKRLVGIMIPKSCIEDMRQTLTRIAQQTEGTEDNPITL